VACPNPAPGPTTVEEATATDDELFSLCAADATPGVNATNNMVSAAATTKRDIRQSSSN
jgi:hypothetical protein